MSRSRLAWAAAAAILAAGLVAAALVVVLHHGGSGDRTPAGSSTSVAAPPAFGASVPVSTPGDATAGPAGRAQLSNPAAVTELLAAATSAIQTVDSYDSARPASARAAGTAVSTGGFRDRYLAALAAIARSGTRVVQTATVQKIAVTALSGDSAGVLAFGRVQTVRGGAASEAPLTSGISLQRVGGTWRISDSVDLSDHGTFPAVPPGNAALAAAATAAAREVVDLLSYTRTDFPADLARALDGLSDQLRNQRRSGAAALRERMDRTQTDYAGTVRSVGVESASGSSVLLLVCATGFTVPAGGSPVSGPLRLEVGVVHERGRWLVSEYLPLPDPA